MSGEPLPGRATRAVRDALLSHGWEGVSSESAANALEPWAHHFTALTSGQVEGLLRTAPKFGIDLVTGDDWAVLLGTRARLSAMARSWSLPPELHPMVLELGIGLPADLPAGWRAGDAVIDLDSGPVVFEALPDGVLEVDVSAPFHAGVLESAGGVLLVAANPTGALEQLSAVVDRALTMGVDAERIALDPGWTPGAPSLGLFRRFGRPLVCSTDDPVVAVLARQLGAQLFRTTTPDVITDALRVLDRSGMSL